MPLPGRHAFSQAVLAVGIIWFRLRWNAAAATAVIGALSGMPRDNQGETTGHHPGAFQTTQCGPEGACHQRRRVPPRELSIDLVANERLGRATGRAEAS